MTYLAPASTSSNAPVQTLPKLTQKHLAGEKIASLTCYDASFAACMQAAGVELLLVGDSLGMVCQGKNSTLSVSVADVAYHVSCVARAKTSALIAADLPFASYGNLDDTYRNAAALIQAGAEIVKIEGGAWLAPTIEYLSQRGIPVWAHLGLMPQHIHQLGGYKVQGKTTLQADQTLTDARILTDAGAAMMLLEAVPASLAKQVTQSLAIPTIGIGAGIDCSGQILVMHDMLDVFPGKKARFVHNFLSGQASIGAAFEAYVQAVKQRSFPTLAHSF